MTKWLQIYFLVENNSKKYNSENISLGTYYSIYQTYFVSVTTFQ